VERCRHRQHRDGTCFACCFPFPRLACWPLDRIGSLDGWPFWFFFWLFFVFVFVFVFPVLFPQRRATGHAPHGRTRTCTYPRSTASGNDRNSQLDIYGIAGGGRADGRTVGRTDGQTVQLPQTRSLARPHTRRRAGCRGRGCSRCGLWARGSSGQGEGPTVLAQRQALCPHAPRGRRSRRSGPGPRQREAPTESRAAHARTHSSSRSPLWWNVTRPNRLARV